MSIVPYAILLDSMAIMNLIAVRLQKLEARKPDIIEAVQCNVPTLSHFLKLPKVPCVIFIPLYK